MTHYFELRTAPRFPATNIGADIARHLEVRQYLGSAVVVCSTPISLLSGLRKQWMHLTRAVQKERSSTLNAEDILRLTHTIMHMQHMQFVPKLPQQLPDAHVYFVTPGELTTLPPNCFTLYLTCPVDASQLARLVGEMSDSGLLVNYDIGLSMSQMGLQPKSKLELQVLTEWQTLAQFLGRQNINPAQLVPSSPTYLEAADDALDTLLGVSNEFLRLAGAFQHTIHLAQPLLTIPADQQKMFMAAARLAHRVQALTPSTFSNYFLKSFGDSNTENTFFLQDSAKENTAQLTTICVN